MTEQPKNDHLRVFLAWPVLSGGALASVLALSVGGLMFFWTGGDWEKAGTWAGIVFFATLGAATLGVYLYAARQWAGNRTIERLRQTVTTEIVESEPEPPRFIRMAGRPPALTQQAPVAPGHERQQTIVARAVGVLADRLSKQPLAGTLETTARTIEPAAATWVKELYAVVCKTWSTQDLTRRNFEALFRPGGAALWRRYVNGDGSGRRAGRGILDTWGVISRTGARGSWQYAQPLDVIFSLDPDLERYARAMSGLVDHSPTGDGLGTGGTGLPAPNQTVPKTNTINHPERRL